MFFFCCENKTDTRCKHYVKKNGEMVRCMRSVKTGTRCGNKRSRLCEFHLGTSVEHKGTQTPECILSHTRTSIDSEL